MFAIKISKNHWRTLKDAKRHKLRLRKFKAERKQWNENHWQTLQRAISIEIRKHKENGRFDSSCLLCFCRYTPFALSICRRVCVCMIVRFELVVPFVCLSISYRRGQCIQSAQHNTKAAVTVAVELRVRNRETVQPSILMFSWVYNNPIISIKLLALEYDVLLSDCFRTEYYFE